MYVLHTINSTGVLRQKSSLAAALHANSSITILDLYDNNIGDEGAKALLEVRDYFSPIKELRTGNKTKVDRKIEGKVAEGKKQLETIAKEKVEKWGVNEVCRWIATILPQIRRKLCPLFQEYKIR